MVAELQERSDMRQLCQRALFPREMRFARPADRRVAKHRKLRSLRAKAAPQVRHYSAEGRCALAIKIGGNAAMEPLRRIFQFHKNLGDNLDLLFDKPSFDSICGASF